MQATGSFTISSRLAAPAPVVWTRVTTLAGVNAELRPVVRLTMPRGRTDLQLDLARDGERLGRSWLLLAGLIPFDYDDFLIERVEPGRWFQENSTMLSQRAWRHRRDVEPLGDASCSVTDHVEFEPRLPGSRWLLSRLFHTVFVHRHRRLVAAFGAAPRP
jgi:hypothetical protein